MRSRVLVVEDDPTMQILIPEFCRELPVEIEVAPNGSDAFERLRSRVYDVVVTDMGLPDMRGDLVLDYVHERWPEIPVLVITGQSTVDGAVSALHRGAFDYIGKPFSGPLFSHRLALALEKKALTNELNALRVKTQATALERTITGDPDVLRILGRLPSIAKSGASVVVTGESGTGKELVAQALHELSERSEQPFITVNCGALPENLIDSELFGHVQGAFTDARSDRAGLISEANTGTMFFDEVGELPLSMQVKLLRFLQEHEYKPVGSSETLHADVRVIAATNRDLEQEIELGRFRLDLYYRLNVVPVRLPPLRQRPTDVPLLAQHFVKDFAVQMNKPIPGISPHLLERMNAYRWPGNIRELGNRVQRMVLLAEPGPLTVENWEQSEVTNSQRSLVNANEALGFAEAKRQVLTRFETGYVVSCLKAAQGNISAAARMAAIDRKNFWALVKKYEIDAEEFRPRRPK